MGDIASEVAGLGGLEISGLVSSGFGFVSALVSVLAIGFFALTQSDAGNDDDDSTPGGGLMQPVA
ncbi:MAG: hypothetical protein VKK62_06805 [Synechococcaceae cyanobacterium]|nr:hypothetical protein [Synechococcaceae cyanobacterium]